MFVVCIRSVDWSSNHQLGSFGRGPVYSSYIEDKTSCF
ncbi:hypothetical protein SLEP1_g59969 [Rubroshorea leprosula]|uniref:Uncharacterized protein n=1 Tax=Rubroshorea leprosula TaxID=152421 RepID=A0AAV5MTX8_9ROSI|nr:hypothetical protein SLEP1_g59969 [Rubroshorea leprosula]